MTIVKQIPFHYVFDYTNGQVMGLNVFMNFSVVRVFALGAAMGCWIDPSWGGPIEPFLVPASAPRLM